MQQRGNTTMDNTDGDHTTPPPSSRGRHNSKLKVLVRSHAMREETSPPREPTPNHLMSPSIKLTPSPEISPKCTSPCTLNPTVVLSPSISRGSSPCRSPTSSVVPSRCSPQSASSLHHQTSPPPLSPPTCSGDCHYHHRHQCYCDKDIMTDDTMSCTSPKYLNKLNRQKDLEKDMKQTSHNNNINSKKKLICECQTQNCIKCIKGQERNINNNLTNINNNVIGSANMLSVSRASSRGKLRQQSSSQGSFESATNSPCLSRDSSSEQYTDTTGVDLEIFIPETLNRNAKDRALMLRIEQELVNLAKDRAKTHYKFPPMSSYQRMLVHRCAAYFGMDHNIESSGKCVVVNKTKNTRIPDVEFKEHVKEDIIFSEEPRRSILKRDSNSIEDYSFKSPDRSYSMENRRSKSFEEREEEYEKARRRIFNNRELHDGSSEDFGWSEIPWSSTESEYPPTRLKLPPTDGHRRHIGKLIKVQSEETGETLRPCVAKSYSFGGYGGVSVLSRGDSVMSTHSAGPRLLTKQDSAASSVSWRLSPSSSGYKSQSQMSESVTPSPTSTPHPLIDSRNDSNSSDNQDSVGGDNHVMWAVTDIHNVPKGSVIINPQTGKPIKNDDGTLYHYDPNNPPPGFIQTITTSNTSKPPPSPTKSISKERCSSPKKRSMKTSPSRKLTLTNSSTSPILPYSPPMSANITGPNNRTFQYVHSASESSLQSQSFSVYNSSYPGPPPGPTQAQPPPPPPDGNIQMYQQPYIVYSSTPFGVPMAQQFDGRIDHSQIPEIAGTYYVPENIPAPPTQTATFQTPSTYWNQQQPITFYQSNHQPTTPTPPQRSFSMSIQNQNQTSFLPPAYTSSYPPQNPEIMPVYPNQSVQMIYANPPNPANAVIYQNQPPVIYTQNPVFPNTLYQAPPPASLPPYPQNTPTPNSCTSSISTSVYPNPMIEPSPPPNVVHLSQNMHQMNLGANHPSNYHRGSQQFDNRTKGKGNKFSTPKGFLMGSSQSSTGTNSPAATVVAGYCPQNPSVIYRTPPETPPSQMNYVQNFSVPPMVFRQMSNVRASTPGTARNSRSPTPASDISHFERQRMSLPPNLYQGLPYVLHQADARLISGRGQPSAYRPHPQHNSSKQQPNFNNQGSENIRYNKGRKSKASKTSGLPPTGK